MKTRRFPVITVLLLLLLVLIALVIATTAHAAGEPIERLWYTPFEDVAIRAKPSLSAKVLSTAPENTEYTVLSYPWSPATAENSWAKVQYRPGRAGYVPVQIGDHIYGQVVFELGIIGGQ